MCIVVLLCGVWHQEAYGDLTRAVDLIKLQHALGGVYIWELVVGINYDWKLFRHKQQHAASLWAKWVRLSDYRTHMHEWLIGRMHRSTLPVGTAR